MINFNVHVEQKRPTPVKQSSIVPVYNSLPPYAQDEKGKIINPTGSYKRVKVGEKNLQEIIDSNIDSCNYYRLIDAFNASGDINILNVCPHNDYGDVSKVPFDNVNNVNDYINSIEVEHVEKTVESSSDVSKVDNTKVDNTKVDEKSEVVKDE